MDSEILDSSVPHELPSGAPIGDYVTRSEVGKLFKEKIKTAFEAAKRRTVT